MNDIGFNVDYMSVVLSDCISASNEVRECTYGFSKVAGHVDSELSSFNSEARKAVTRIQAHISEIRDLIRDLDGKISKAESKRQKELNPPPKPSVPSNATPEQKNAIMSSYHSKVSQVEAQNAQIRKQNERIDSYISKCNEAKSKLEDLISHLHSVESTMKSEIELTVSRVHEFTGQVLGISNGCSRVCSAMSEFGTVFEKVCDDARSIYNMEPTGISSYVYMDRQFVIKNTHAHLVGSGGGVFNFSGHHSESKEEKTSKKDAQRDGEPLIKEKDEASFFEALAGADKIKMPSSNLHKLGGKKFMAKMNQMGYTLALQEDGAAIDSNGMLHWEK